MGESVGVLRLERGVAARKQLLELDKLEVLQLLTMATRTMAMLAIATLSMAELDKLGAL